MSSHVRLFTRWIFYAITYLELLFTIILPNTKRKEESVKKHWNIFALLACVLVVSVPAFSSSSDEVPELEATSVSRFVFLPGESRFLASVVGVLGGDTLVFQTGVLPPKSEKSDLDNELDAYRPEHKVHENRTTQEQSIQFWSQKTFEYGLHAVLVRLSATNTVASTHEIPGVYDFAFVYNDQSVGLSGYRPIASSAGDKKKVTLFNRNGSISGSLRLPDMPISATELKNPFVLVVRSQFDAPVVGGQKCQAYVFNINTKKRARCVSNALDASITDGPATEHLYSQERLLGRARSPNDPVLMVGSPHWNLHRIVTSSSTRNSYFKIPGTFLDMHEDNEGFVGPYSYQFPYHRVRSIFELGPYLYVFSRGNRFIEVHRKDIDEQVSLVARITIPEEVIEVYPMHGELLFIYEEGDVVVYEVPRFLKRVIMDSGFAPEFMEAEWNGGAQ